MTEVAESRTPGQWAQVIRADLGQAVAGFISAGKHLAQAKAQLGHGEWLPWIERELPVSERTVQTLIKIAENPALADPQRVADLPPSWGTLYELSRLDAAQLDAAIEDGRVHPELERSQARALVAEARGEPGPEPPEDAAERRRWAEQVTGQIQQGLTSVAREIVCALMRGVPPAQLAGELTRSWRNFEATADSECAGFIRDYIYGPQVDAILAWPGGRFASEILAEPDELRDLYLQRYAEVSR